MSSTPKDINCRTSIYVLKHPITKEIRYVGKTIRPIQERLKEHIYLGKTSVKLNHRINWTRSLLNEGLTPEIEEIDFCPWCESQSKEIYYIKFYKDLGCDLVNETDGGEGCLGLKYSEVRRKEEKERIREKLPEIYQCEENGNIIKLWNSAPDAAEALHIQSSGITRCLRGERNLYKGFIWKYVDEDEIFNDDNDENIVPDIPSSEHTKNGGYKQSPLARVISFESRLQREAQRVYIFSKSELTNNNFLHECISLYDAGLWLIDNGYSSAKDPNSLKSKISSSCNTNAPYLKLYFSYNIPEFITNPKSKSLFYLEAYDNKGNFIVSADGLNDIASKLDVDKTNIINYLKCVTKFLMVGGNPTYLSWKIKPEYCRLVQECIGESVDKIEENPNNYRKTSS